MIPNPGVQTLSYNGPAPSGGNPGFKLFKTPDAGLIGGAAQRVAEGECNVFGFVLRNQNAFPVFLQFFDIPIERIVLGTTLPVRRVCVPSSSGADVFGQLILWPGSAFPWQHFFQGLTVLATTQDADLATGFSGEPIYAEITYCDF